MTGKTLPLFISVIPRKGWEPRISVHLTEDSMIDDLRDYYTEMTSGEAELSLEATFDDVQYAINDHLNEQVFFEEQSVTLPA